MKATTNRSAVRTASSLIRNPKPWTVFDNIQLLSIAIMIFGYVLYFRVNKAGDGRFSELIRQRPAEYPEQIGKDSG